MSLYEIKNITNDNRVIIDKMGPFQVLEHVADLSVTPYTAETEYFNQEMNVHRKQLIITLNDEKVITQAGAMQWTVGNIEMTTGIKGAGDLIGKMFKGKVTGEAPIKPEYVGTGHIMLEPTYKHIILQDVSDWGNLGLCVEDGMFLACEGTVTQKTVMRSNVSSAVAGGEGLFNLALTGQGVVALESYVPKEELMEVVLEDDVLKVDGSFAVCWSAGLAFTVERSSKSLIGSAASGEGLVNVYRGTGKVLLSPVADSHSSFSAIKMMK